MIRHFSFFFVSNPPGGWRFFVFLYCIILPACLLTRAVHPCQFQLLSFVLKMWVHTASRYPPPLGLGSWVNPAYTDQFCIVSWHAISNKKSNRKETPSERMASDLVEIIHSLRMQMVSTRILHSDLLGAFGALSVVSLHTGCSCAHFCYP